MLVSQFVIPSRRSFGGALPYVFTEQGVAMLSSVLRSERAALVIVAIARLGLKYQLLNVESRCGPVRQPTGGRPRV